MRMFNQPSWNGNSLAGQTILLHAEQGLGDTLQFIRYAPIVKQLSSTVLFECPPELIRIIQSCAGIDRIIPIGQSLPAFDCQLPLMSLPHVLKTTMATVPASVPYLKAEPALMEQWRQELARYSGFKIGIVWQGNPRYGQLDCHNANQWRSIPLAQFAAIADIPRVKLFSLQKGPGTGQLAQWQASVPIVDLGNRLLDFMDTAAVMTNLDLIITCDTSVSHLAGARLACLDDFATRSGLALVTGARGLPVVSNHALISANQGGRLGGRVQTHRDRGSPYRLAPVRRTGPTTTILRTVAKLWYHSLMQAVADLFNQAVRYHQSGALANAEALYQRVIQADPAHAQAYHLLGILVHQNKNLQTAEAFLGRAVALQPGTAVFQVHLGMIFLEQKKASAAADCFRRAAALDPHDAEAHKYLGLALFDRGALAESAECFRQALRVHPNVADAYSSLGNVLKEQGRLPEAMACYDAELRLHPGHHMALWNRSLVHLLYGDYKKGWPDFERRWARPEAVPRTFAQPRWDGSALTGKTVLVHTEYGLGDTLQFLRSCPRSKNAAGGSF